MKLTFKTTAFLIAAFTIISFGIQSCTSVKPIDKGQLEGYWVLKSLKGEDAATAFTGTLPNMEFNFADSTLFGNGGCNTFRGQFSLTDQNIFSAPNLASTMMACLPGNKEPEFMTTLSSPNLAVSIENGLLTFKQDETVVLQFQKGDAPAKAVKPEPVNAESLTGTWTLTSIAGEDMATLFPEKAATMEIAADGKVFGNAGCNTYRTSYTLDGDMLTFAPAMATKMACPAMQGETKFLSHLATPLQAATSEGKLLFNKDGNMVLEFTKMPAGEAK